MRKNKEVIPNQTGKNQADKNQTGNKKVQAVRSSSVPTSNPPSPPIVLTDIASSRDNEVRPFQIGHSPTESAVRGRAIRLGTVAEQILSAHRYPDPVARILGEALALAGLLGSVLKDKGIITFQIKSGGPIPMLVVDYQLKEGKGYIRGYADIDKTKLSHYGKNPSFEGLIGSKSGYLAITIDPGEDQDRYQGIVDLKGSSLSEVASTYFMQSEQLPTALYLAADKNPVTGHWRAGGAMIQHLARAEQGQTRLSGPANTEDWVRANMFLETLRTSELLDPQLTLDTLLYRLFHEDQVRVFDPICLAKGCRCDQNKLYLILQNFSNQDRSDMIEDDKIRMTCQFCNKNWDFDPAIF